MSYSGASNANFFPAPVFFRKKKIAFKRKQLNRANKHKSFAAKTIPYNANESKANICVYLNSYGAN